MALAISAAADSAAAGATAFSLPGVLFDASGAPTASAMENATASASPSCAAKSTPNRISPWYSAIFTAAGLASNIFALVVVARAARRTRSRSRGAFLAVVTGLVATDLAGLAVTGAVVVSMHALDLEWTRVDPRRHLCRFFGGCMVFFGLSPLLLGCAMAVERGLGIARPLVHAAVVTRRGAGAAVLSAWALALVMAVAPAAGLGSYSVQWPGSWCFLATEGADGGVLEPAHAAGAVCFSLLGLLSLAASHVFNSTTVLTLVRARRCGAGAGARRRHRANKHELEMVVQLLGIMVIATVCWTPLLVFIANIALKSSLIPAERHCRTLILGIRMATWNQILDPWVYILFRRSVMLRLCPGLGGGAGGGGGTAASSVRSLSAASVSTAVYGAALRTAASVKGAPEGAAVATATPPRGRAAMMPAVNGGGRGGGGGGGGGDTGGGRGRRGGGDGRGDGGGGTEEESRL
ncbi:thromboxane A2 receptor-like [Petromyzon marinus]|uniref:Thromboxane A2 receptor n=1 Tax=Petromyzon marinus TaxID=7757 RepID=A0AAJ7U141_PETMA|nr:thromboxane A2 receptor-like [Petromyzon marinus]XP_032826710.1 thromboxane A2 receptor-like [Petromyzon marinus]XP_032826711.1 thromboxane A2 receptor-like [Petromyzon marinus]XP_032826712.1 thromboxane A2 receptor-like [Petromyzon marinus]